MAARLIPKYESFMVSAKAKWAESSSTVPVRGESWFVADASLMQAHGADLIEMLERARGAYPAMMEAIERIEKKNEGPKLCLRALEVFEDDVANTSLGGVRKTLETRAQVCGMRVVAAINASAGATVAHGMPLGMPPTAMRAGSLASMLEEIELIDLERQKKLKENPASLA